MITLGKKKLGIIVGSALLAAGVTLAGFQIATAETQPSSPVRSVVPVSITSVTPTATPTPVVEVAVEAVTPAVEPAPAPAPAPVVEVAPIKCPAGSFPASFEGYNDTSCLPESCAFVEMPGNPEHPECDNAFKP